MTIQNFDLKNLSCPACIMHLEAMEETVPGVHRVHANYQKQALQVEYDESVQSPQGIVDAVSEMGYVAIPRQTGDNNKREGSIWKRLFH